MRLCPRLRSLAPLGRVGLLITLAALSGCDYPTTAPLIDVKWVFPIDDQTLSVVELLPAGVDTVGGSFAVGVDPFALNQTLGVLCPACVVLNGLMVPTPPFNFSYNEIASLPTDVVSVDVETATFSLGIQNDLGFDPLRPAATRDGTMTITKIPVETKEEWLQSVIDEGSLALRAGVAVTELALSAGPIGLQVSTLFDADASLGPDAVELALFGNAGRTGSARTMNLEGTSGNGWMATTAALSLGIPLAPRHGGSLAAGATLKYTVGHVVGLVRDDGSMITADPIGINLMLPSIAPDSLTGNNGTGLGLDLGIAWEGSVWAFSAALQNVFNTFQWNLDDFAYRPGVVFAEADSTSTDFDAVPAANAPVALQNELLAQSVGTAFTLGAAFRPSDRIALTADFRKDGGETLVFGEGSHIGVGAELRLLSFLPLRGGMSRVSGGAIHFAAGVGLELGPIHFSSAYLTEKNSAGEFRAATFALSFGHN